MGYCSKTDITNVITQALTSATASTVSGLDSLSNLLNVGNTLDNNLITDDTINSYIQIADSEIDAMLSELYQTPFNEVSNFETILYSDITEYNGYIVTEKPCPLTPGDQVILYDGTEEERLEIEEVISSTVFSTTTSIQYFFTEGTRIIRVSYPNPIRYISARFAAANIYDKYFSAEVSPNTSTFGKQLREIARQQINNILNGRTILHGQRRIGDRFLNSTLRGQYGLPDGSDSGKDTGSIQG